MGGKFLVDDFAILAFVVSMLLPLAISYRGASSIVRLVKWLMNREISPSFSAQMWAGEPNETVLFIELALDISAELCSIGLDLGLEWLKWLAFCGGAIA